MQWNRRRTPRLRRGAPRRGPRPPLRTATHTAATATAGVVALGLAAAVVGCGNGGGDSIESLIEERGYRDPTRFVDDVVAAADLGQDGEVLIAGEFGLVGVLRQEGERGELELVPNEAKEDFVSAVGLGDGEALLGSASGSIFRYGEGVVERVDNIHEHDDSVLSLAVQRGADGSIAAVWAGGARGLLARSDDGGETWKDVAPETVHQPPIAFPDTAQGTWHLGVANIIPESVRLTATSGGAPLVPERDYDRERLLEDGTLSIHVPLDASPVATISFDFAPGPPFQAGDYTINAIAISGDAVTLAGEFGMILQGDGQGGWLRRNGQLTRRPPEAPYWIQAVARDDTLLFVGAAGAVLRSDDGGQSFYRVPVPAEDAAVFGAHLGVGEEIVVAGAVGLLADYRGGAWSFADRSRLDVYSWLKTLLPRADGGLLGLGGRGNCVYRSGSSSPTPSSNWERCRVAIAAGRG